LLIEPANRGQGALHIEAVRLLHSEGGTKAQFEHQQRVFQQDGAQGRHGGFLLADTHEKGFGESTLGMSRATRASGRPWRIKGTPIQQGKQGAIPLHQGVRSDDLAYRLLVKVVRDGYDRDHERKLLSK